ncbi:MAG TPA: OB-fold nucleic acid binding domain-containing protein [Acidimicrobiales bacterium]
MGLRGLLNRLSVPVEQLDEQRLREFCAGRQDAVPIGAVTPRAEVTVVGEVTSVRFVPRGGTAWLEATVSDGRDRMVAMWTGRRRLRGLEPGRRLLLAGRASQTGPGGRMVLMNPRYDLLPFGGGPGQ